MKGDKDRVFIYKSQAIREYGVTAEQISNARELGLINTKVVPNPFDKNTNSLLIDVDSLCSYLEKIQKPLPNRGETKLGIVDARKCIICGVPIKSKKTLVGHISEYCEEHDRRKIGSKW